MKSLTIIGATLLAAASGADLKSVPPEKRVPDTYVVRLEDHVDRSSLLEHVRKMKELLPESDFSAIHLYKSLADYHRASYSVKLSSRGLDAILKHEQVKFVEEDEVIHISDCVSQTDEDWGTARINHRNYSNLEHYSYDYTTGATGANVDAYVLDTGIYCENDDFVNKKAGSCSFGYTVIEENGVPDETDGNGHGTHVAGILGGQRWGAAKEVNLIAVKVLSDSGSGTKSLTISGVDWVVDQASTSGKKSIANLSLGGSYSQAQNDALAAAYDSGVLMVVAAGNDNHPACDNSPASEPTAVTVAATDSANARAAYSNFGECVDIFGPGSAITSAYIGSPTATAMLSGTSMASPQVCGTAAKFLSADPSLSPADLTKKLLDEASTDELFFTDGSPNLMVYGYCS